MLRFASTTFRNYAQAAPDYCESYLPTSKNRARTAPEPCESHLQGSKSLGRTMPQHRESHLRASKNIARVARDHCQSHLKTSENVTRAAPERCESDLRALKTMPERRTNVTKMLSEQRLAAARVRPRAMACNVENRYLGGRARKHFAARARRRKNGAFLDMQSGPCFQRQGCVNAGTQFSQKGIARAAQQQKMR